MPVPPRLDIDEIYLDSEILADLRQLIKAYPAFERTVGKIAQFKIVIDANVAIADLLLKHKYPERRQTAIEETVKSSALSLHAPRWLDTEMVESTIPKVAKKKKIPEPVLLALWSDYKQQIVFDETLSMPEENLPDGLDAKDVPYVSLQKSIEAVAVLSRDVDLEALGGKTVKLQFVLSLREYARSATRAISLKVGGTFVAAISIGALVELVKGVGAALSRMPDLMKIMLIAAAVTVIAHPRSRQKLMAGLQGVGEFLVEAWPLVEELIDHATESQKRADGALENAETYLAKANQPR